MLHTMTTLPMSAKCQKHYLKKIISLWIFPCLLTWQDMDKKRMEMMSSTFSHQTFHFHEMQEVLIIAVAKRVPAALGYLL